MTTPSNKSTTSLESTTPTLSTPAGVARQVLPAQKDYAAALGILQSRYGSGGAILPSPKKDASTKLPQKSPAVAATASSSLTPAHQSGSSAGFASPATLAESLDLNQTSTTPESSSSSLVHGQSKRKIASKLTILKSLFKGKTNEHDTTK
ncbi:hypothetical protein D9619_007260 [Psilocybe cf. subviscida]|uniref:Uncharacterized protein n=1 Tax=Psilocybe cf. subviscida TaxID=2480587 RepID=A0A8H5EWF6_9AGAR|nr:hypothetical protein D9619_007260 [Psilocybe cf. subviscida]